MSKETTSNSYVSSMLHLLTSWGFGYYVVFIATFNTISAILRPSVLLVEETREKHRPATSHWQTIII